MNQSYLARKMQVVWRLTTVGRLGLMSLPNQNLTALIDNFKLNKETI